MGILFEWDGEKEWRNQSKHGVSFDEARTAFNDPFSVTRYDPRHSWAEDRFILIGRTRRGRLVVVVHAFRGTCIRLISARLADSHERETHEEA